MAKLYENVWKIVNKFWSLLNFFKSISSTFCWTQGENTSLAVIETLAHILQCRTNMGVLLYRINYKMSAKWFQNSWMGSVNGLIPWLMVNAKKGGGATKKSEICDNIPNTLMLAAKGALAQCLQRLTACQIQCGHRAPQNGWQCLKKIVSLGFW